MQATSSAPDCAACQAPGAVLFDAYGTVFDVYSVAALAEELFPGHGQQLSVVWRDKQIQYTRLVTTSNHGAHYQPFGVLTRCALVYAIKKVACRADTTMAAGELDPDNFETRFGVRIERLMAQYQSLSAFPESAAVLRALQARAIPSGILSNGEPAMLAAAVKSAGLQGLLGHVISVDTIRKYKTHPDAYALGEQATGLPASRIVFVSSNAWDALAATWYGYRTLWVNRYDLPFEELGTQPTRMATSLRGVLGFFPE